jgi:NAD(P)-dependent dehydrogenase (short-subunit alcohol dehydrogenase family)
MGAAHARRLARDGAVVAVNDRQASPELKAVAEEIGGLSVPVTSATPGQVHALVAEVARQVGDVDVLVANHAYMTMAPSSSTTWPTGGRWSTPTSAARSTWCRPVLPGMRRRGAGRIVVVSSEWGVTGWPGATAYAASKAGLISLTKTLGRELAPEGIIVNALAPGVTDTPQLEVDARDAGVDLATMHARYAEDIPLGRIATVEEMAEVVALLADFRLSAMVGRWCRPTAAARAAAPEAARPMGIRRSE